jgi:hypothetical protein
MWNDIDTGQHDKNDMKWIAEGMTAESLTWTTNRSYDRKRAQDLSGVGWIIFCNTAGQRISGSFGERSLTANSFHAEMLDLCALHLLTWAISEYYRVERWSSTM